MTSSKIKVLIIDDSALVREVLSNILSEEKDFEVVGSSRNPIDAIDMIKKYRPDVLTLDLQMPKMDGLTFMKKLMAVHPMPIIVISSLTKHGSKEALKALELGAVDVVAKPTTGISTGLSDLKQDITKKIRDATKVRRKSIKNQYKKKYSSKKKNLKNISANKDTTIEIIAIGASTGGTVAVRSLIEVLPANMPGIIVVLHMPQTFTATFAESLNQSSNLKVKEAEDGEAFEKGVVYIAPGDYHLTLSQGVSGYFFNLDKGPKIHHVRPAIDKTFLSIAEIVAPNCIGVILTGMGSDGTAGLKRMYKRNAYTIVQDEESSVVFGMPKKAIEEGVVDKVLPLDEIGEHIIERIQKN